MRKLTVAREGEGNEGGGGGGGGGHGQCRANTIKPWTIQHSTSTTNNQHNKQHEPVITGVIFLLFDSPSVSTASSITTEE